MKRFSMQYESDEIVCGSGNHVYGFASTMKTAKILAVVFCKPCGTTPEVTGESRKALAFVAGNALTVRRGNAGDKKRLVDIHSTADGVNDFQHNTSPQSSIRGNRQGLDVP